MSELRELCYPGTDVLMLCFSLVRPETFRSVAERWTKAVANVNAPLILVGTQSDLVQDSRVVQTLRVNINKFYLTINLKLTLRYLRRNICDEIVVHSNNI